MNAFEYMLRPLKKYADFSGRASRSEFWFFLLFVAILLSVAKLFDGPSYMPGRFSALVSLLLLCPQVAVAVRRLHDVGKSGKELVLPAVLLVAGPVVGAMGGFLMQWVKLGYAGIVLLVFAGLVMTLVRKGSSVPNKYGPAPEAFSFAR